MINRFGPTPLSACKVLLVEDDQSTCAMYAAALRMEGFQVRTAFDGLSALRLVESFDPDVLILDLKLPTLDGFEVIEELRTMQSTLPVIAVSSHEPGVRQAERSPAFFAALQKPFDPNELIGVTRRAAQRRSGFATH